MCLTTEEEHWCALGWCLWCLIMYCASIFSSSENNTIHKLTGPRNKNNSWCTKSWERKWLFTTWILFVWNYSPQPWLGSLSRNRDVDCGGWQGKIRVEVSNLSKRWQVPQLLIFAAVKSSTDNITLIFH